MRPLARLRTSAAREAADATGTMRAVPIVLVLAAWGHALLGVGNDDLFSRWVYLAVSVTSALLCLRATPRARWVWGAFAAGLLAKSVGDLIYNLSPDLDAVPVPSVSDPLWLASYPCAYVGLLALTRRRMGRLQWATRLDGLICGLAVASVLAIFTMPRAFGWASGVPLAEQVTTLAYPFGDLALLGAIVMALAVGGWRLDAALAVMAGAVCAWEVADLMYLHDAGEMAGRVADALVLTGVAGLGYSSTLPLRRLRRARDRGILLPIAFGGVALAVLVLARPLEITGVAIAAAAGAVALALLRAALVLREHRDLLARSEEEAGLDALTGLANRRHFTDDLEAAFGSGAPHGLVVLDLNGFKAINDTFGHAAGDAMLVDLGERLRGVLRADATAYRLGGDEFCVLARCEPEGLASLAGRCAAALTHRSADYEISAACGAVVVPGPYSDAREALAIADTLMYGDKRRSRTSASVSAAQASAA
jgi:diguanylate cyclase (GGDEF)-like protein